MYKEIVARGLRARETRRQAEARMVYVVKEVLETTATLREEMNEALRGMLGALHTVDEMALMFRTDADLKEFLRYAVRHGYTLFNSDSDTVTTGPLRSSYDVAYWFLAAPGYPQLENSYRLELMTLHTPGSPLHDTLQLWLDNNNHPSVAVHASFKCHNEEEYANAVHTLGRNGYELTQRCESTYGRFSYWQPQEAADHPVNTVYLKPRVNLRDAEEA